MKKLYLFASLVLLSALSTMPCTAQQTYTFTMPAKEEPIYGTWVNTEYSGWGYANAQKYVFLNWGFGRIYALATDESPAYEWTFILLEKQADASSNTWYKVYFQDKDGKSYCLCRLSNDGTTLEIVRGAGFPTESDLQPANSMYRIFRHQ